MLLVIFSLVGCELYEWATGSVNEAVSSQGIDALEGARDVVKAAESSPGKRRVLRIIRKLKSEIDAGERSGFNGNVFAAAVERVAKDGIISSTEAGIVEDAYQKFLDGDISRGKFKIKMKAKAADDALPDN
ncbi:MAG: hypothetical protein AAGA48_40925 [Myxococcota bacterium]